MRKHHRDPAVLDHPARRSSEQRLPPSWMIVRSHDDKVCRDVERVLAQDLVGRTSTAAGPQFFELHQSAA